MYPDLFKELTQGNDKMIAVSLESKVLLSILYGLITFMSLVGNSLVIVTFAFDKNMRSVTNVFILSLAVADLMVTLTCVPINLGSAFDTYWIFGPFACKLVPFFMTFSVACSSLTLCSIALDRYVAIVHPYKLKFLQNPKPAAIFLVGIWALSFICSVPNAVFYTVKKVEKKCEDNSTEENYVCVWPENKYKLPLELWLTLVVLFIIPLLIMSTTYGLIGYQLWIRKPVGMRRNSLRNADMKKSVIKMLVIVMLAFIICWSPIMVLNSVEKTIQSVKSKSNQKTVLYLKFYFQCLSMASCCINPVIYTFMNRKFRMNFMTYLCCRKNRVSDVNIVSKVSRDVILKNIKERNDNAVIIVPRT
ncbi:cholecystokinin receptor type A-like [Mercenaria mercenaria]|uniref:cholecystokinin receptor type A-like n=1 Tax=Mercenaria mercenaria TaxID=6596 RepID=UPI001E1D813D|nr:cholecystokinin receptor type A-like [Mercenaria mercenaria]